MKKRSLLAICLIVYLYPLSAQPRLAVFSVGTDTLDKLPCIDIDFFRSLPAGQLYGPIGDHFVAKYITTGHTRFSRKAKAELSPSTGTGYFGAENEAVPAHYNNYLQAVIGAYKGKLHNNDTLHALQNKVWSYNVLDELGFINREAADQQEAYTKAKEQFTFRYGLAHSETDSATEEPMTILSKASQIYYNRKFTVKATEKLDSLHLTDSTIVYRQTIETHSITAHYHDIPVAELEPFATALKEAIYLYIQDYRIHPEQVEVSKWSENPASYILTFSAENGSFRYVRRVGE